MKMKIAVFSLALLTSVSLTGCLEEAQVNNDAVAVKKVNATDIDLMANSVREFALTMNKKEQNAFIQNLAILTANINSEESPLRWRHLYSSDFKDVLNENGTLPELSAAQLTVVNGKSVEEIEAEANEIRKEFYARESQVSEKKLVRLRRKIDENTAIRDAQPVGTDLTACNEELARDAEHYTQLEAYIVSIKEKAITPAPRDVKIPKLAKFSETACVFE